MQIPVASIETTGGRSACLWGMPFLTAVVVPFSFWVDSNLEYRTSHAVLDVFMKI
jgi:hypothetical protein